MVRALVTGASGFLGLPIVRALDTRGYEVHGVSRSRSRPQGAPGEWHVADLLDPHAGQRLIQRVMPHVLVHAAWETTHGQYWGAPVNGTWASVTLELARAFA